MEAICMLYGHIFGHILDIFFLNESEPICLHLFLSLDITIEIQGFRDSIWINENQSKSPFSRLAVKRSGVRSSLSPPPTNLAITLLQGFVFFGFPALFSFLDIFWTYLISNCHFRWVFHAVQISIFNTPKQRDKCDKTNYFHLGKWLRGQATPPAYKWKQGDRSARKVLWAEPEKGIRQNGYALCGKGVYVFAWYLKWIFASTKGVALLWEKTYYLIIQKYCC